MRKSKKVFIFITICLILAITIIPTISRASAIDNPDHYKNTKIGDLGKVTPKVNSIIGTIVTVGIVASVITLLILGIKYMVGSVEEKAEYKKSMLPYLIGSVLLFSASTVVSIIANLTQETIK